MTRFLIIVCVAATIVSAAPARGQVGPNLDLSWNSIDGGGGPAGGGAFAVHATIGQPDAGTMSGGVFELRGGLWGAGGQEACYPDCNGNGTLTVADFGCFQTKFVTGDPYADCNLDTLFTVADFGCFQTKFVVGCP